MSRMKGIEKKFYISAGCFLPTVISLLLLPLSGTGETAGQKILGILIGVLFWAGVLLTAGSYFLLYRSCREQMKESTKKSKIPSCFRFFSNPIAVAVDAVLITSFIGTLYSNFRIDVSEVLEFISLVLFIIFLYLHFLVNGKIFQYIVQGKKRGKEYERKM